MRNEEETTENILATSHNINNNNNRSNNHLHYKSSTPAVDYSSLDAFLDGSLLEQGGNMSRTTKEWRSSFSTVRDRFGNQSSMSSNQNALNNHYFTTNGSVRMSPKRELVKSASQGSLITDKPTEKQRSLLANAVEHRRAAEAPDLRRPTSRRDLGDFWTETIENRSVVPRALSPLTAAQRMEMLHETINECDTSGSGRRRLSAASLATRKANFLKEAVKGTTSLMDRVISGRSTPITSIVNSNQPPNTYEKKESRLIIQGGNNLLVNKPDFAALDSAVAELNGGQYTNTRRSGCAQFPTNDLSLFGNNEAQVSSMSSIVAFHSPSPEALSDTSSNSGAPSGLPHPKPKHNIREQLIQAGLEPRGTAIYVNRSGVRFGSSPNFPVPSSNNVASRISEFEKKPGAPNLLQIACALNSSERQKIDVSPIRSPLGPMSPRSSVYRTKPVIHADMTGTSQRGITLSINSESVFQFPPFSQSVETKNRHEVRTLNV
ncbi:unnamed protein product [Thelazia callipaeda]|uniref:PH domain-containing protein n=1 Tax=Thelazia callipaeda TaxID=103827 RepID=A0A0N5D5F3_THECL|nr:unnamed protein product [Thelazia callipaeda]